MTPVGIDTTSDQTKDVIEALEQAQTEWLKINGKR